MTLDDFVTKCGKSDKTVRSWLEKGYVPGAYIIEDTNSWYIPDSARVPYTKRKPRNGGVGMYKSIAKAVSEGYGVCAELYHNVSQQQFEMYTKQLIDAGIITFYSKDGIIYYETTLKTADFLKMRGKALQNALEGLVEAGVKGAVEGFAACVGAQYHLS